MPSSHFRQLNEIVEAIVIGRPRSILDVGVGFAKYGLLAREYLDAAWCRTGVEPTCRIDGVEGFAAYVGPLHRLVYDHVYVGDALEILPQLDRRYDLALLIDVVEHLEFDRGLQLLHQAQRCAANILVSTPKQFQPQDAVYGNELEIHRSHWLPQHLASFQPRCLIPNDESVICLIGPTAPLVDARFNCWRRAVKRNAPWLAALYRKLKA